MTLKGFSRKYGIPYHIVYEASYNVQPVINDIYEREYPESDMVEALHKIICFRIDHYQDMMIRNINYKHNLEDKFLCDAPNAATKE